MKREDWIIIANLMITIDLLEAIDKKAEGSTKITELILALTEDLKRIVKEEKIEE